jgi:hypothetical protein
MAEVEIKKLTTREWILSIVLLALVQFIVQASVFVYCGSGNALNYWSLVGTSVSIILALLAIIWSFIQNLIQQKGSSTIASQIERLQTIVVQANNSGIQLSSQMDRLDEVRTHLQETLALSRQSRDDIAKVRSNVQATQELVEALSHKPADTKPMVSQAKPEPDYSHFLEHGSLAGAYAVYACYLAHKNRVAFDLAKLCESIKFVEHLYAHGYLVAASSVSVLSFTVARGIWNITAFNDTVGKDIQSKLKQKVADFEKGSSPLAEELSNNVTLIESFVNAAA